MKNLILVVGLAIMLIVPTHANAKVLKEIPYHVVNPRFTMYENTEAYFNGPKEVSRFKKTTFTGYLGMYIQNYELIKTLYYSIEDKKNVVKEITQLQGKEFLPWVLFATIFVYCILFVVTAKLLYFKKHKSKVEILWSILLLIMFIPFLLEGVSIPFILSFFGLPTLLILFLMGELNKTLYFFPTVFVCLVIFVFIGVIKHAPIISALGLCSILIALFITRKLKYI